MRLSDTESRDWAGGAPGGGERWMRTFHLKTKERMRRNPGTNFSLLLFKLKLATDLPHTRFSQVQQPGCLRLNLLHMLTNPRKLLYTPCTQIHMYTTQSLRWDQALTSATWWVKQERQVCPGLNLAISKFHPGCLWGKSLQCFFQARLAGCKKKK